MCNLYSMTKGPACELAKSAARSFAGIRMTWAGQELLSTMRKHAIWERTKAVALEKGVDLGFDTVKAVAAYVVEGLFEAGAYAMIT
jgi:hypothetical protein